MHFRIGEERTSRAETDEAITGGHERAERERAAWERPQSSTIVGM